MADEKTEVLPAANVIYKPTRVYEYRAEREVGGKKKMVRRLVDQPTEFDSEGRLTSPPTSPVIIGKDQIKVPDAEIQLLGFYSDHAARLARSINQYKLIKPLGKR